MSNPNDGDIVDDAMQIILQAQDPYRLDNELRRDFVLRDQKATTDEGAYYAIAKLIEVEETLHYIKAHKSGITVGELFAGVHLPKFVQRIELTSPVRIKAPIGEWMIGRKIATIDSDGFVEGTKLHFSMAVTRDLQTSRHIYKLERVGKKLVIMTVEDAPKCI